MQNSLAAKLAEVAAKTVKKKKDGKSDDRKLAAKELMQAVEKKDVEEFDRALKAYLDISQE